MSKTSNIIMASISRRRSVRILGPEGEMLGAHGAQEPQQLQTEPDPPSERPGVVRGTPHPVREVVVPPAIARLERPLRTAPAQTPNPNTPLRLSSRGHRPSIPSGFRECPDIPALPAGAEAAPDERASSSSSSARLRLQGQGQGHASGPGTSADSPRNQTLSFRSSQISRESPRPRTIKRGEDVAMPSKPDGAPADADRTWPPSWDRGTSRSMAWRERSERVRQSWTPSTENPPESVWRRSFTRISRPTSENLAHVPTNGTPGGVASGADTFERLHVHNLAEALGRVRSTGSEGTVHTAAQLAENVGRLNALLRDVRDEVVDWDVESDVMQSADGARRRNLATTLTRLVAWSDDQTRLVTQILLLLPTASEPPARSQERESSWRTRLRQRQASLTASAAPPERPRTRSTYREHGLGLGL